METKVCCICGRPLLNGYFGNNPQGAVDENKKEIQWKEEDRCCDECNRQYVLPGRMYKFYRVIRTECLVKKETE